MEMDFLSEPPSGREATERMVSCVGGKLSGASFGALELEPGGS